jgi:GR25 family glycosyltransferase involved in LPS biosynthesis
MRAFIVLVPFLLGLLCTFTAAASTENSNEAPIQVSDETSIMIIPPIYVLNLDRSTKRWETTSELMRDAGLKVHRLPAVDGRQLSPEELLKESTRLATFLQPRGVIGCFLSHRKFWQKVVDEGLESAIVFEDDVELVVDFKQKLEANLRKLRAETAKDQEFDVILLGAIGRVHPDADDAIGSLFFSHYIGGKRPLKHLTEYRYQPRRPAGTHAYMVSNKGARKLLELCRKATYHVDLDAWRHPDLDITMFRPMLAYQTFEHTSLTDVSRKRNPVARKVLKSGPGQAMRQWTADAHTKQPWSHVSKRILFYYYYHCSSFFSCLISLSLIHLLLPACIL